jgi:UV DNA damage repair endonuclease
MKLGLVCISEQLKSINKEIAFRTMTRKRFNDLTTLYDRDYAIKELSDRILINIEVTGLVIDHCEKQKFAHYRLTCAGFPLITDPTLDLSFTKLHNHQEIKKQLNLLGKQINESSVSIGSHTDQFNVLASLNQDSVNKTIKELNFQTSIIDMMLQPRNHKCPVNIHINASPANKLVDISDQIEEMVERFYAGFSQCNESVKTRLTLENEDKGFFSTEHILMFHARLKQKYDVDVPICYDNLHDACNNTCGNDIETNMNLCMETWPNGVEPVFHWSEGKSDKPRSHRDYFTTNYFPPTASRSIKWECEVKAKDNAICQLLNEHEAHNLLVV